MDKFDELLLKTIDKTMRRVLGGDNAVIIYNYLEKNSCPIQDIPKKLDLFSAQLRNLLGVNRGQILGAPTILEDTIVEELSSELGLRLENESKVFVDRIRRLKEMFNNGKAKPSENSCKRGGTHGR
jgi:hypothetical protein